MKNLKFLLGIAFVLLFFFSCEKQPEFQVPTQEVLMEETSVELRRPSPCGKTGFDVLEHYTEPMCKGFGLYWWYGRCIICR